MNDSAAYFAELKRRAKESRAYRKHQLIGLEIADILDDRPHKALYIKLAKERDGDALLKAAQSVAERKNVAKKGAYFMWLISRKQPKKIKAKRNAGKNTRHRE